MYKLLNFIVFQLGWIIAVFYHNVLAGMICLALAVFNFWIPRDRFLSNLLLGFLAASLGLSVDLFLVYFNILYFPGQSMGAGILWLAAVWLIFISTFHSSLSWVLKINPFWQAIFGSIGGALSYSIGVNLRAIDYNQSLLPQFVFLMLIWAVLFPSLCWLYNKLSLLAKST